MHAVRRAELCAKGLWLKHLAAEDYTVPSLSYVAPNGYLGAPQGGKRGAGELSDLGVSASNVAFSRRPCGFW